jgi:hypothetical protein
MVFPPTNNSFPPGETNMTYEMQRDFGKDDAAKGGAIRFRRLRALSATDISGQEEIAISGLMAAVAAHHGAQG